MQGHVDDYKKKHFRSEIGSKPSCTNKVPTPLHEQMDDYMPKEHQVSPLAYFGCNCSFNRSN
jgi:hypothetical protein